jgi:RNA polymerase sigma-70 factor (ECF subfamily)
MTRDPANQQTAGESAAHTESETCPPTFEMLWAQQRPRVARTARGLTGDAHDAEDLVQETAVRALRGYHGFEPGTDFAKWVTCILYNTYCSGRRQSRRRQVMVAWDEVVDRAEGRILEAVVGNRRTEPEPMILNDVLGEEFEAALARLPDHFPSVFELACLRGMSYVEVGQRMRLPLGTVRSRLFRAREQLRTHLTAYGAPT